MSKKTVKIGDFCRTQIMENVSAKKIVKMANKRKNGGNVNLKHIAWYAWDMRKEDSNHNFAVYGLTEMPSKYAK